MPETWPSSLPDVVNSEGFKKQFGSTVLATDMDIGLRKIRRRYTKQIDVYDVSMDISREDYPDFEYFYNTTLNGGVNTFYYNDPLTGNQETYRFDPSTTPSAVPIGNGSDKLRVSFVWEKMP